MSKPEDSAPPAGADAAAPATPDKAADAGKTDLASAARKSASKGVWMGTAVGIGSAAIVAALLYTRKKG
ncbi:hypothetical protein [Sphingobium sp. YR768]|jgi:hypothetical protein|uniref:hypothetical protein n=1 Tax=Sphingobium sp. YR768 TaxID=1884365 RepID=UPI0008B35636|nr:hypothetical protein [Sphingobium sp. YR768]SER90854.1 hypothetical protein SAMN05518866_12436 [Sphingobium sp. YR768]